MKLRHLVLALLTASCATTQSIEIPDLDTRLDDLTEELSARLERGHVPGMAIAIVLDDEVVYARGFGLADLEQELPATPETLFAIGSSTKAFTSTCIGMLIDEWRMSWDDPITDHLPCFEMPVDAGGDGNDGDQRPEVLVRDLLSHRTGFTRMGILWGAGRTTREEILRTATKAEPWSPFRKAFFYNNVMYLAAGEASAAASGMSWDELVTTRLLDPLGMEDSDTSITVAQKDERLALGYLWEEEKESFKQLPMRNLDAIAPAGAINSNVLDMAQWVRFQLARGVYEGQRLVSSDRIQETWSPQISLGPGMDYGLGWFLSNWKGQPVVEHGGNIDGFSAVVALLPESKLGFVMLTNASSTPLQQDIRGVVWEALLGERAAKLVSDSSTEDSDHSSEESWEDYLGEYIANYAQFEGETFTVRVENDRLAIDIPSQRTFELLEADADGLHAFAVAPEVIQLSFDRDEDGTVTQVVLHQGGLSFEVPRAGIEVEPEGSKEEFARYLGAFDHPLLPEAFTVDYEGGRLTCDIPGQMKFALRLPDEDGIWKFRATDLMGLEFHEDEAGEVATVTFHERGTESVCPRVGEGAADLPAIEEVLALRRATETGQRIEALGNLRLTGRMRFVHSGVSGTNVVTFADHQRYRQESSFEPFGWSTTAFDGTKGWIDSSFQEFEELEGKLLDQLLLSHPAVFFGDWRLHFDQLDVVRASTHEGRKRWVVRLKKGDLPAWMAHVDAETGDVMRVDSQSVIPGVGSLPQTTFLEDHREVEGLRFPHRIITETSASGRVIVDYDELETGLELAEGFFSPDE